VRWFLVFWLFVLSSVAFLDRVNISIAGSSIATEYRLSNVQLGYVFSAFLIGYALFQTFGGWLADRLGPRRVLAAGVLWWGIFTALTALVSSTIAWALLFFILVRFLLGAGEAIIYPASNQFVSRWIPSQERGVANGLIFAGVGVGAAGGGQAECLGLAIEIPPGGSALGASRAPRRIDADTPHAGQIDHQAPLAHGVARGVVAAAPYRDQNVVGARKAHRRYDIGDPCASGDQRRSPVDHAVVHVADSLVARVSRLYQLAAHARPEILNRSGVQRGSARRLCTHVCPPICTAHDAYRL